MFMDKRNELSCLYSLSTAHHRILAGFVSDIAIFVRKGDVKLQLTN